MYRRILIAGATAAAIVGVGGTAMALTGTSVTNGSPSPTASASSAPAAHSGKAAGKKGRAGILRRLAHGQIVTRGKGGFVTHDLIAGNVTHVSATSITVQAADKKSETFTVSKATKVRARTVGKGASTSSIGAVHTGDHVLVAGTGTSTFAALHIVDIKK